MRLWGTIAAFAAAAAIMSLTAANAVEGPEPPANALPAVDRPVGEGITTTPDEPALLDARGELPAIERDLTRLPTPVRRLREQIIAAASTVDPEALRPIFEANGPVELGPDSDVADPGAQLQSLSGDPEGREILAVLIEVLEASRLRPRRRRHAGGNVPLAVFRALSGGGADAAADGRTVQAGARRRLRGHEGVRFLHWFRVGMSPDGTWQMFSTD